MADQRLRSLLILDSSQFTRGLNKASSSLNAFGSKMSTVGRKLTTSLTLPIAAAGIATVKAAADFQRLRVQLDVLTGSAKKGGEAFERLKKFSAQTPFQLKDLVKANNTLMGFGVSAEDAFKHLKMLGDVAAVTGGDISGITIAFGQAAAEGRVMTRDLRQFINNGIPILQLLAESMNVAEGEIMGLASEGKITFDILTKAFSDATSEGGKFNNGMKILSKTFHGQWSTLKDNLNIALAEFGKLLLPAMQKIVGAATDVLRSIGSMDSEMVKLSISIGLAVGAIGPLLWGFGKLASLAAVISSPIGIVAAAIATITTIIVKNWDSIAKFIAKVNNKFIEFYNTSQLVRDFFWGWIKVTNELRTRVVNAFSTIADAAKLAWDIFTGQKDTSSWTQFIGKSLKDIATMEGEIESLNQEADKLATQDWSATEDALGKYLNSSRLLGRTADEVTDSFQAMFDATKKAFGLSLGGSQFSSGLTGGDDSSASTNLVTGFQSVGGVLTQELQEKFFLFSNKLSEMGDNAQWAADNLGGALMDSFTALGSGGNFIKTLINAVKQLIVKLAAAAATALILSALLGGGAGGAKEIFGNLSGLKLGGGGGASKNSAAFAGVFSAFGGGKPPSLASGGIVSSPTLVQVGEYLGARNNPEVIAPLNKLQSYMNKSGSTHVTGEFALRGQDLVVALQRANTERDRIT